MPSSLLTHLSGHGAVPPKNWRASIRRVRFGVGAAILGVALASCAASEGTTPTSPVAHSDAPEPSPATSPADGAPDGGAASPGELPAAGVDLAVNGLAEVMVDDLSLRSEPSTAAERMGFLPMGEPAYVVAGPVEADGYQWYQLASVRQPYVGTCGDPAPEPSLECAAWFGWAAGMTADGDRWLEAIRADCPTARDTEAYLSVLPAERLSCAGGDEWRLRAYVAPQTEGRGCYPVYVVDPGWLDASCNFSFLQREESQYDSFEGLQVFLHPDLGSCALGADRTDCPFEDLKGSWIEVVGQLDDAAAHTCAPVVSSNFEEAPYPPPSSDEIRFGCRTRFVVTEIIPG